MRFPVYGSKTRDKIREDIVLKNFPLFCPKCKSECLIDIEQFHITVIKVPDAEPIIHSSLNCSYRFLYFPNHSDYQLLICT